MRVRAGPARAASTRRPPGRSSAATRRKPDLMGHVMLRVRDVMRESFPIASYERAGARGRADHGPRRPRPRPDRRRRRRADRRDDRARARPPLRPRVAQGLEPRRRADLDRGDRRGRSTPRSSSAARARWTAASGSTRSTRAQRQPDLRGRRRRRRQPGRRPAPVARARRLPAHRQQRRSARRRDPRARPRARRVVAVSPLDSYVSSRMVTLAAPCGAMADREPLTVGLDDLITDISEQIKDVHYRAAVAARRRAAGRSACSRAPTWSRRSRGG